MVEGANKPPPGLFYKGANSIHESVGAVCTFAFVESEIQNL